MIFFGVFRVQHTNRGQTKYDINSCLCWDIDIWLMNMGFWCFFWVWYMVFVEIDSIKLVLHVYTACSCIMLCFVLCCAYHVGDKMSFKCFCVYFWTPLSTKILGIIIFPCFEISNDYVFSHFAFCMFSCPICTLLHMMHTHTTFDMLSV